MRVWRTCGGGISDCLASLHPPSGTAKRGKLRLWPLMQGKYEMRAARSNLARAAQSSTGPRVTGQPPDAVPQHPPITSSYLDPCPQGREPAGPRTCCRDREHHPQQPSETRGAPCLPAANCQELPHSHRGRGKRTGQKEKHKR